MTSSVGEDMNICCLIYNIYAVSTILTLKHSRFFKARAVCVAAY